MENVTLSGPERAPAKGEPKQLVIMLHGLGADGNDLIGLAPLFAESLPHAQFLSPNAPFHCDMGSSGYQWFSLRDWSPQSMLRGAHESAPLLDLYVDLQLKRFNLPDSKLAFIGFSQGTMMSLYVSLRRKQNCGGVVGFSGALIGEEGISARPPVCLIHGTEDTVVPFGAMGLAEAVLTHYKVPVETHKRPHLGHGIDPKGIDIAKAFLKEKFA